MDRTIMNIHAPDLICVGIDECRQGEYAGRIWHQYDDEPFEFRGILPLVRKMEELYDSWDFPQASTIYRSLEGKKNVTGNVKKRDAILRFDGRFIWADKGNQGTFMVHVRYRQNATWQGEVVWIEKRKKESFRSVLELLKMIDDAMNPDPAVSEGNCLFERRRREGAERCLEG